MQVFIVNQDGSKTPVALKPAVMTPVMRAMACFSRFKACEEAIFKEVIGKMVDVDDLAERAAAERELERRVHRIAVILKDEMERHGAWQDMWPEDREYVEDRIHAEFVFQW